MSYKTETTWAKRTEHNNGITVTRSTLPKTALDLGLKVAGAAAMYGIGRLVGEGVDHIPYLNEWIPQVVDYVSAIDIQGNIDGLVGLMGGIYGLSKSGVHLDDKTLEAKEIALTPIHLNCKSE